MSYNIDDMRQYASYKEGKCLSQEFIDISDPLVWMCAKGHQWKANFAVIRQGGWCAKCAKQQQNLERIRIIVEQKGIQCLSTDYIGDSTKLQFECEEHHTWWATPNNIKKGSSCRKCADKKCGLAKRDSIASFKKIAESHGGKCLSEVYNLNYDQLEFECKEGHRWKTKAANVKNNRWCPKCAYVIRGNKQRDSIETYRKIAVERNGKCLSEVYIRSWEKLEFECSEGHRWKAKAIEVKRGSWCGKCGRKNAIEKYRDNIAIYQKIAESRGGKCLSADFTDSNTKLKFRCSEGHEWMASPLHIKSGQWCRICGYKIVGDKLRGSIEIFQNIAKQKGGKCLSQHYVNCRTKMEFECVEKHRWKANGLEINRGKWCIICERNARLSEVNN